MNTTNDDHGLEREAKALLTKEQYQELGHFLKLDEQGDRAQQLNRYFMDAKNSIRNLCSAGTTLRNRSKKGKDTLELKLPKSDGESLEYSDPLSLWELETLIERRMLPEGSVKQALDNLGICGPFQLLGAADTLRATIAIEDEGETVEIMLDMTTYPDDSVDYEIEVEASTVERANKVLLEILQENGIEWVPAPRKIERFYKTIGL